MGVRSLGYLRLESTDLEAWKVFGGDFLGMMPVEGPDVPVSSVSQWQRPTPRATRDFTLRRRFARAFRTGRHTGARAPSANTGRVGTRARAGRSSHARLGRAVPAR